MNKLFINQIITICFKDVTFIIEIEYLIYYMLLTY